MRLINSITKGFVTDIDEGLIPADTPYEIQNYRIDNNNEQGFVVANIKGMRSEFQLSSGFRALGGKSYNGILYILSVNDDTGEGEIGCFPSPVSWSNTNTSFERVYKPLYNFTGTVDNGTRQDFRTTLFNFSSNNPITGIVIREDYDGSVNIYYTDNSNPIRVINSGFDKDGRLTDRTYYTGDFPDNVNLIQNSVSISSNLSIDLDSISTGGTLPYGNYVFYFRYLDAQQNHTPFLAHSNACQIYDGDINHFGGVQGGSYDDISNKKIVFNLTNIDTSYEYIEIVYVRFYSDDNGILTHDTGVLPTLISISNTQTIQHSIENIDNASSFTDSELIEFVEVENVCKLLEVVDSRLFMGNFSGSDIHNQELVDFANRVTAVPQTVNRAITVWNSSGADVEEVGERHSYKDYNDTYDEVSYFHNETYPFSIIFETKEGNITEAYPVKGYDYLLGVNTTNGCVRFPKIQSWNYIRSYSGPVTTVYRYGISFVFDNSLISDLQDIENQLPFINGNIRGFYFVRGDRYTNLLFQGLMMAGCKVEMYTTSTPELNILQGATYNGNILLDPQIDATTGHLHLSRTDCESSCSSYNNFYSICTDDDYWGRTMNESKVREGIIPLYRCYLPMIHRKGYNNPEYYIYQNRVFPEKNMYAIYSPDLLFEESSERDNKINNIGYVERVGKTLAVNTSNNGEYTNGTILYGAWNISEDTYRKPQIYWADMYDMYYSDNNANISNRTTLLETSTYVESKLVYQGIQSKEWFTSMGDYRHGAGNGASSWVYWEKQITIGDDRYWSNRAIKVAPYLGVETSTNDGSSSSNGLNSTDTYDNDENFNLDIVNCYIQDPSNIDITSYDTTVITYKKISDIYLITDVVDEVINNNTFDSGVLFNGDCFTQRTYIKQISWMRGTDNADDTDHTVPDDNGNKYGTGLILGIITQNALNTAMRHNDEGTYYPKCSTSYGEPDEWMYKSCLIASQDEDFLYNKGYNEILGLQTIYGYDPNIPYTKNRKITRIKYTNKYLSGMILDAWRETDLSYRQDYDIEKGELTGMFNIGGTLVSIQEKAINQHYVNQKLTKSANDGSGGEESLIIGIGDVLSENVRVMAEFGSQHTLSMIQKGKAVYGIDWKRSIVWNIGYRAADNGNVYLAATDMTRQYGISKYMRDLKERYITDIDYNDRLSYIGDNPLSGEGISSGIDNRYDEIYFTFNKRYTANASVIYAPDGRSIRVSFSSESDYNDFMDITYEIDDTLYFVHNGEEIAINDTGNYYIDISSGTNITVGSTFYIDKSKTLCFSEGIKGFLTYTFTPDIYMTIDDDTFSPSKWDNNNIWLHDVGAYSTFYGYINRSKLGIVVNGVNEKVGMLRKIYKNIEIDSNEVYFNRLYYSTEYQVSEHYPFNDTDRFWLTPEYKEDKWVLPVNVSTNNDTSPTYPRAHGYNSLSYMRGMYLRVLIEDMTDDMRYIKTIITDVINSKV